MFSVLPIRLLDISLTLDYSPRANQSERSSYYPGGDSDHKLPLD